MRRIITVAVILVVALIVLLVLGVFFLNVNRFRPRIQTELQNKLGRPVTLGELHLHLIPFSIKVDGVTIGESTSFNSSHPFATAKDVYASASLMSLIKGEPQISNLTLNQPQIELIKNAAGAWNFSALGNAAPAGNPPAAPGNAPPPTTAPAAPTTPPAAQKGLTLNELKINDGQVAVTDQRAKSPRSVYNHVDLKLTDFAPNKPFHFDAGVHVPGSGKGLVSFVGQAGPLPTGNSQILPITGHLSLDDVSLAGINNVAPGTIPPNTDASTSGAADFASSNGTIAVKGNLNLNNPVVKGAKVNYPIETQYSVGLNQQNNQINISSASVKIGPTAVAMSGTVDSGVTPSNLNLRLGTNNASITELARLASLFGVGADAGDQIKGSLTADLQIAGPSNNPQIQGNISAPTLQAQDIALTNVKATAKMNNGVVTLAPLTAGIFGGQESGTITLDSKPAHPLCAIKTHFTGVDSNALLSAVSTVKNTLFGSLAADADLHFAVDKGPALAKTLNGVVNFDVTNGRLQNINILNELAKVGKFLNPGAAQQPGNATTLQKLAGTMNIQNGLASTSNLVAAIPQGSLSAQGTLSLVTQALNMHMNAVLANNISKAVGGNSVGGYLNTALANNKGELVLPVIIGGTTDHPSFAPDVQAIAKMKISHLLPTSGDPSKMAGGLLNSVLGGKNGQQSNQNGQQQKQNPLNSILKGFGKK